MQAKSIRLALTPGEPAGIGIDIALHVAQSDWAVDIIAFADPELLSARAMQLGLSIHLDVQKNINDFQSDTHHGGQLKVLPIPLRAAVRTGELNPANAAYVLDTLQQACRSCMLGDCAALVTGPIHKGVINAAGIPFTGHTEFLAAQTQTPLVVMMLATEQLRVALVTTHLPLAQVCQNITATRLQQVITILHRDMQQRFHLPKPRILVCGLNPHAGEDGHMGREEIDIIIPVLEKLRQQGMDLRGPAPADTAFTQAALANTDVVLSMYHDQGLPVLKHQGFGQAINVTLGLPIIRTSVDHGTALALAGTGQASSRSLVEALRMAIRMSDADFNFTPSRYN